jgi:hypothetical protein
MADQERYEEEGSEGEREREQDRPEEEEGGIWDEDEAPPRNAEEEMKAHRAHGRTLKDINDLTAKYGVDVCLNENTDAGRAVWEEATDDFTGNRDYEVFRRAVPQGPVIARSALEFAIINIPAEELDHDRLVRLFREFFRMQFVDYELAWGFNADFMARYRGLMRIDKNNFGGRGMVEREYFAAHQWHLNDNTYNRLCEELRALGKGMEGLRTLPGRFPHIPFKVTWEPEVQRSAWSRDALSYHESGSDVPRMKGLKKTEKPFTNLVGCIPNYGWWYKGDMLRDARAYGIDGGRQSRQSTPERGAIDDDEWPPLGGGTKGHHKAAGKPLKGVLKAGKGGGIRSNPGHPGSDPSSSSSSSSSEEEVRKEKKKKSQGDEAPEDYKKKQYARGANYGDIGDTSLREPGRPVYTYVTGPREKEGDFAEKIKNRSMARGVGDERATEMGAFLEGVREIVKEEVRRSRTKEVTKERKRDASELRLGEYDVDYNGGTVEEILGRRFKEAAFKSDVERQLIAKDLNRWLCSVTTRAQRPEG